MWRLDQYFARVFPFMVIFGICQRHCISKHSGTRRGREETRREHGWESLSLSFVALKERLYTDYDICNCPSSLLTSFGLYWTYIAAAKNKTRVIFYMYFLACLGVETISRSDYSTKLIAKIYFRNDKVYEKMLGVLWYGILANLLLP